MRKEYHFTGPVSAETTEASLYGLAEMMTGISVVTEGSGAAPSPTRNRQGQGWHPPNLTKDGSELMLASLIDIGAKVLAKLDRDDYQQFGTDPIYFWEFIQDHASSAGHWFSRGYLIRHDGRPALVAKDLYTFAVLATDSR